MFTTIDQREGLVKLYWHDVRQRVKAVEPDFAELVDELSPDNTFPIYLAYIKYGELKGDTVSTLLPRAGSGYFRVTDADVPQDIKKHLGYSCNGSPFGMVLEKQLEYFIDLKHESRTIPWEIYKPGDFFSFGYYFNDNSRVYAPNSMLTVTAGARSSFMLPNIGCAVNHSSLQRDFNLKSSSPKSLYNHWEIFKEIITSEIAKSDWRACVMYFSEKWLQYFQSDSRWAKLKNYLYKKAWNNAEYEMCRRYYDITFSLIENRYNLKPNPYLADTARHLFTLALGKAPGFAPATNEDAIPKDIIQAAYVNSYELKKYFPTIMVPVKLRFEIHKQPTYYSLQNPSTYNFSPKARKLFNVLLEMRELAHIMNVYIKALKDDNFLMGSDSVISEVANRVNFNYYHNKVDHHKIIQPTSEIFKSDERFGCQNHKYFDASTIFSEDAAFLRGCISIQAG